MKGDGLLEDIKSRVDIVDFISSYVQLKKAGQNWKGLCPFHSEKTPSFTVNQAKQIFHCFGCGTGGDIISFVSRHDSLSFHESVNLLAKKAGITLAFNRTDKKTLEKNELIRNAVAEAMNYFIKSFGSSAQARDYIKQRGLNNESIALFKLGYAPAGWHNLLKHLRKAGYMDSIIKEAGLAVAGDKGLYDIFRERIMFPITGISGNTVAFGGRAFGDAMPKYINSPETSIFKKSETLFGLYTAKEEIIKNEFAIIVEGYMDVIICHQYGFRNAVAPLGTSLTPAHINRLRTLTRKAVIVFDADQAGIAAAKRALKIICQNDFRANILLLPDNEDPDSFLRKHGSPAFNALIEKSKSMIDFLLGVSKGEKIDIAREALSMIADVKDILLADEMLVELADKTGINESTARQELRNMKKRPDAIKHQQTRKVFAAEKGEEHLLLSAIIAFPEKSDYVLSRINPDEISDKVAASLLRRIASLGNRKDLAVILESADENERILFTKLCVDPGFDLEFVDRNIDDCLKRITQRKLDEKIRVAKMSGDLKLINALLSEKKNSLKETEP